MSCETIVWLQNTCETLQKVHCTVADPTTDHVGLLASQLHPIMEYGILHTLYRIYKAASDSDYFCIQQATDYFTMQTGAPAYSTYPIATRRALNTLICWNPLVCDSWSVSGYIVVPSGIDVRSTGYDTVGERFTHNAGVSLQRISSLLAMLTEREPLVQSYLNGTVLYPAHIFAMPFSTYKTYFNWLFNMMREVLPQQDTRLWSRHQLRLPEYLAEMLFGVYIQKLQQSNISNLVYSPSAHFDHTTSCYDYQPAFGSNNIAIALASSDYFAPYASVTLQSILDFVTPEHNYDIFILSKDLSEVNGLALQSMVHGYKNVSLRVVDVSSCISDLDLYIMEHFTIESYFRSMIPYVLPYHDKVIYCDSDLIWKRDCADLFATELGNNLMAAVIDPLYAGMQHSEDFLWAHYYNESVLHICADTPYTNTGVIVMNTKLFRRLFSLDYIMLRSAEGNFIFCDQDCLNILCEHRTFFLDYRWNTMTDNTGTHMDTIQLAPADVRDGYFASLSTPYVLHFADKCKPWQQECCDYGNEFWGVARRTPFYENILFRMSHDILQCKAATRGIVNFPSITPV